VAFVSAKRETGDTGGPLPFPSPVPYQAAQSVERTADLELRHRSGFSTFVVASAVSAATLVAGICSAVWLTGQVNPNAANQGLAADIERAKPPKLLFLPPTAQGVGQPVALGMAVHDLGDGGLAVVRGLADGTTLSIGKRANADEWWLSAIDLSATKIEPPPNFVGAMDVTVDLRLPNTELVDRQTLHFTWQAPAVVVQTPASAVVARTIVTNTETRANSEVGPSSPVIPPSVTARHLSSEEVAASLKRGEDLVANGDLGAARLVFQRLVEDGNANAALALAKIYDPMMPEKQRAHGFESDAALAQYWYEKAKALGSNDVRRKLQVARHSEDVFETGYATPGLNGH
jgi:hypothetical protein